METIKVILIYVIPKKSGLVCNSIIARPCHAVFALFIIKCARARHIFLCKGEKLTITLKCFD